MPIQPNRKKPLWTVVRDAVISGAIRWLVGESLDELKEILTTSEDLFDDLEVEEEIYDELEEDE